MFLCIDLFGRLHRTATYFVICFKVGNCIRRMVLHAAQSGSRKRVKLKWDGLVQCPHQPGIIECGYYMLVFMKEIIDEGVQVWLIRMFDGLVEYTDAQMDKLREEWAEYVSVLYISVVMIVAIVKQLFY